MNLPKEEGISPDQELTPDTTNVTPNDNVIVGQSELQGNDNTTSGAEVFPFGVDPLATSRLYMHKDLAKSGLVVSDFPVPPEPLPTIDGRACYKLWYTPTYYKLKIDRDKDKYVGIKGVVPPIVPFGKFEGAPVVASVEGLKKALLFHKTTGLPTLAIDSCWGFGEVIDENSEIKAKELHSDIVQRVTPGQNHLVLFDGDWSTNDNVKGGLSTYRALLEEYGSKLRFKDLGHAGGYDDWFVAEFTSERTSWPTPAALLDTLLFSVPDVPAEELLGIAQSMAITNQKQFNSNLIDLTDRGAGTLLIGLLGANNIRYCGDIDNWICWNGKTWDNLGRRPLSLVNAAAAYFLRRAKIDGLAADKLEEADRLSGEGVHAARVQEKRAQAKAKYKFAMQHCSSSSGRNAVLADLEGRRELWVYKDAFDAGKHFLAFPNGVLDLRTGELRPETQEDLILRHCPDPYSAEEPTGENVNKLKSRLYEVFAAKHGSLDRDVCRWFQRRMGAILRGYSSLASLELWVGEGANGKSVLSNLIQAALGDVDAGGYACTTNAGVVLSAIKPRDAESSTPFLVKLIGARVVFMSETRDTAHLNEPLIKQLTGGDKVAARGNYQDGHTYNVTFSPVLLTNSLPNVAEGGAALWDRMSVIPFACRWRRVNRAVAVEVEDRDLPPADPWFETVGEIMECRQWIIWWLVQGGIAWEKEGLGEAPARIKAAGAAYKEHNDPLDDWLQGFGWKLVDHGGVISEETSTPSAIAYQSFRQYCTDSGGYAVSQKGFTTRLLSRFKGLVLGTTGKARVIVGLVRVKPEAESKVEVKSESESK